MATRGQLQHCYPSQQLKQLQDSAPYDEDPCSLAGRDKVEQNSFPYGRSKQQPSGTPPTDSYRGDMSAADIFGFSREGTNLTITDEELEDWNKIHKWGLMTRTIAHYQRLEQVGEGTYGQVYKARCISTGRDVALKKIRVHHGGYKGLPTTAIREIKIMKQLHHKNMVELIEVLTSKGVEYLDEDDSRDDEKRIREKVVEKDKKTSTSDHDSLVVDRSPAKNSKKDKLSDRNMDPREGFKGNLFLVLEYVSHDLTGLMDMCFRFTEVQAKCIFRQLLDVLDYIHTNNYVHRDLKCSNILLTSSFQLKLADFGLARCLDDSSFSFDNTSSDVEVGRQDLTNKVITLWYRPPELLLGETRYGTSVDIWSAGCILAELLLGRPIFTGKTEMEQLSLIFDLVGTPTEHRWEGFSNLKLLKTGEFAIGKPRGSTLRQKYGSKNKMSPTAIDLLEKLLELDPAKRITAGRALTSRYFLTEPRAPENPEELGSINLGADGVDGHFHEFQTKKRRREAKVVADKARKESKAKGCNEKEAEAAYSVAYEEHILRMAVDRPQNDTAAKSPLRFSEKGRSDIKEAADSCNEGNLEGGESNQPSKVAQTSLQSSGKDRSDDKEDTQNWNQGKREGRENNRIISQRPLHAAAEKRPTRLFDINRLGQEGNGTGESSYPGKKGRREVDTELAAGKSGQHETVKRRATPAPVLVPKGSEGIGSKDKIKTDHVHDREKLIDGGRSPIQDLSDSRMESLNGSDLVYQENPRHVARQQHLNKPEQGRQKDKHGSKDKPKRARSPSWSSSSSSYSSSYSSTSSSESSQSNHRRRSSRSKKRRRSISCSPGKGSRRLSEKRKERGKDHTSRRRISKASDRSPGSQREWGKERDRKSQGGGNRSHRERTSERHRHGNERVREQVGPQNSGYENWDEVERSRGKDSRDHRKPFNETTRDTHKSQGPVGANSDGVARSWIEPAHGQEKPPNSERQHRFSDRHRDAIDTHRGPIYPERRGHREKWGKPERGKRW